MENDLITERRIAYIAYLIDEHKLDALIITRLAHIRYLTGFSGSNAVLLITPRNMYFITDARYEIQVMDEVYDWKVVIAKRGLIEEIKRRNYLRSAKRIGFEAKHISYEQYNKFKSLFKNKRWSALDLTFEPIMLQKEQYEIDNIKQAVAISENVFDTVLSMIRPGISEKDIAAEITYLHKKNGAEKDAFEPIVASGDRAALPHGRPSDNLIKRNELLLIDFGCVVNGYHSDITRTIAIGKVGKEVRDGYTIVHEALEQASESIRDGIQCKKLDKMARDHIKKNGYGDFFKHSLGHGIGLDVHELPRISPYSNEKLMSGSTITVEPGIYLPGKFGIRIEDDVLVKGDGYERLTTLSRELITV